jgi:pilus assembly protein CpaF
VSRLGFVGPLLDDPTVEEIIVLGGQRTFVVRAGAKELMPTVADIDTVRGIADQLLAGTGRRLDLASPIVSAQLDDGSRVHITGPPVTRPDRLNIQIRKFVVRANDLNGLVELGTVSRLAAKFLRAAVAADQSILVAGAPGAGKTTLANCLLSEVPPSRRLVLCEEVFELDVDLPDVTQMQTRDEGLNGGGEITLRHLVRAALRQRPDRIVLGEVRGAEALDLLMALNAGCAGLATVHANSANDALEKLVSYCLLAGENVSIPFVRRTVGAVVDLVIFLRRSGSQRRIEEIVEVVGPESGEGFLVTSLFQQRGTGLAWTGSKPVTDHLYDMEWPR